MGLYENIRETAKIQGKSINQIERELGLPRSSIAKYNTHIPSADKVLLIANYLSVSVDYLLTGKNYLLPSLHDINSEEYSIITAYRKANAGTKDSICKLLDIKRDLLLSKEA